MPLNLETLAKSSELEQQRQEREHFSSLACGQALALLGLAEKENYHNRERVIQACHLLMDAIQATRHQIDPYLHLARIFLVFQDDRQALKYLKLAQEIDAQNPDVLLYLAFLSENTSAATDPRPVAKIEPFQAGPDAAQDFDLLYAQIEKYLYQKVQGLMNSGLSGMGPTLSAEDYKKLCQECSQLQTEYAQLQTKLKLLETEMDIAELQKKARPLEILLMRFNRARQQSEQLQTVFQRIDELNQRAFGLLQKVRAALSDFDFDTEWDHLVDHCDLIADQLDDLDLAQIDISPLSGPYANMIAVVNQIQDHLE